MLTMDPPQREGPRVMKPSRPYRFPGERALSYFLARPGRPPAKRCTPLERCCIKAESQKLPRHPGARRLISSGAAGYH